MHDVYIFRGLFIDVGICKIEKIGGRWNLHVHFAEQIRPILCKLGITSLGSAQP